MKHLKIAFLALLVFVGFNKMNAQDKNNPWSIGVGVNTVDIKTPSDDFKAFMKDWGGESDLNIIPTISRLSVGRYLDSGFSLELAATVNKIEKGYGWEEGDPLTDDAFLGLDASLLYSLSNLVGKEGWFDPYLTVGGGYSWFDWEGTGTLNGGAGANLWFNKNVGLFLQTQYKHSFDDMLHPYFQHAAGFKVRFGGTDTDGDGIYDKDDACPEVFGLAAFQGCPDSDGDGIKDSEDRCPDAPGTAEFKGCPDSDGDGIADIDDACPTVAGLKALNGCPDADGDGVADNKDECPQVAGPKENNGCPWPDTDGDGILDKDDACPTVAGVKEEKGCPAKPKEVITVEAKKQLEDFARAIYFNSGKDTFKPGVPEKLDMIADIMKQYPEAKFNIDGHTDSDGSNAMNLNLSQRRATAVMNYLVGKGVEASRLAADGYGEERPIATNATADGKALNRRVEINLK